MRNFGIRRGEKIATSVTVRGAVAMDILARGLRVKEFVLPATCFSDNGNFGFGVQEHIDMGYKYDTSTGIFGATITVNLSRRGRRVCLRKKGRARIGKQHKITKEEAKDFFINQLSGTIR